MKGSILDFLNVATEKPELAKAIAELAARFDFEFTSEELSEEQLESVAGGLTIGGQPSVSGGSSVSGISTDQVSYLTFTLKNAMVDSCSTSSGGDDRPDEEIGSP